MNDTIFRCVYYRLLRDLPIKFTNPLYQKIGDKYYAPYVMVPALRKRNLETVHNSVALSVDEFFHSKAYEK